MDRFLYSGPKPQFNVCFFNRKLHLQTNEKFCTELSKFIFADEQFTDSFGYLGDDLKTVLNRISTVVNDDDDNPVVIKTGETILIIMSIEEGIDLANLVLLNATPIQSKVKDFPLNSFVAFGKRLIAVVENDEPKTKFREVIIERRFVR